MSLVMRENNGDHSAQRSTYRLQYGDTCVGIHKTTSRDLFSGNHQTIFGHRHCQHLNCQLEKRCGQSLVPGLLMSASHVHVRIGDQQIPQQLRSHFFWNNSGEPTPWGVCNAWKKTLQIAAPPSRKRERKLEVNPQELASELRLLRHWFSTAFSPQLRRTFPILCRALAPPFGSSKSLLRPRASAHYTAGGWSAP